MKKEDMIVVGMIGLAGLLVFKAMGMKLPSLTVAKKFTPISQPTAGNSFGWAGMNGFGDSFSSSYGE